MLKTLLRNIVHFPAMRMGFYFLVEKGIFLLFRGKIKCIRSPSLFASEKDEFTFLEKSNYTGKDASLLMCTLIVQ